MIEGPEFVDEEGAASAAAWFGANIAPIKAGVKFS
jgi:hypothetical protein